MERPHGHLLNTNTPSWIFTFPAKENSLYYLHLIDGLDSKYPKINATLDPLPPPLIKVDGQEISPTINPQITGKDGRYGWDVVAGCCYVVVRTPGYMTIISPLVGVPPEVTDLDIALSPSRLVYLPSVIK